MDMAEAREKRRRDVASRLEGARQEGLERGRQRTVDGIGRRILRDGDAVADIVRITGLSAEEIERLR